MVEEIIRFIDRERSKRGERRLRWCPAGYRSKSIGMHEVQLVARAMFVRGAEKWELVHKAGMNSKSILVGEPDVRARTPPRFSFSGQNALMHGLLHAGARCRKANRVALSVVSSMVESQPDLMISMRLFFRCRLI